MAPLRSEASVRQRVAELRANFAELRQAAAGDPELLDQRADKFKQAKFAFPRNYSIRMDVGPSLVADLR